MEERWLVQEPGDKEMCDDFQDSLQLQRAQHQRAGVLTEPGKPERTASHSPVIGAVYSHSHG